MSERAWDVPDVSRISEVVGELVRWATTVEQPDDAVVTHHGRGLSVARELHIHLSANVLIFAYSDPDWEGRPFDFYYPGEDHWSTVDAIVREHAVVSEDWNGGMSRTKSYRLVIDIHPSLKAAYGRYIPFESEGHDKLVGPVRRREEG